MRFPKIIIAFILAILLTQGVSGATDWSKEMVESTIKRYPTAESLKGWGYAKSLYLYGQYLVYLRTKDARYLQHIRDWIDLHVDEKGVVNRPITALDYMLPANLCEKNTSFAPKTCARFSTPTRARKRAVSGTPTPKAARGNYGRTAFLWRCRFWFVTERCSATKNTPRTKPHGSLLFISKI